MITLLPTNKHLLGSVKSIFTERSDLSWDSGKIVEGLRRPKESMIFNVDGKVTEITSFLRGEISDKVIYLYDAQGNLTESDLYKADGSIISKTVYLYEDGNLISHLRYDDADSIVEKAKYTYTNGRASEVIIQDSNDRLRRRWTFDYNSAGGRVDSKYDYDENQIVKESSRTVYDTSGRIIELACYDSNGKLKSRMLSSYDSNGNNIEQLWYDSDSSLTSKSVFTYDHKGYLTGRTEHYAVNDIREEYSYNYEFDDIGNWIKKMVYKVTPEPQQVLHPGMIIYQTITYH